MELGGVRRWMTRTSDRAKEVLRFVVLYCIQVS